MKINCRKLIREHNLYIFLGLAKIAETFYGSTRDSHVKILSRVNALFLYVLIYNFDWI